jgi:uncharacterized protein involved in exopolysaccharide biosynthesis
MPESEKVLQQRKQIEALEKELADLEARLPAHSISPSLVAEMDRLDEEIQAEKTLLEKLLAAENAS